MLDLREYGKDVRRRRKVAGLSQERLAAMVDLSGKTVANIEAGRGSNPSTRVLLEQALMRASVRRTVP